MARKLREFAAGGKVSPVEKRVRAALDIKSKRAALFGEKRDVSPPRLVLRASDINTMSKDLVAEWLAK